MASTGDSVRIASLTWNRRTAFADGVGERAAGGKLTDLGVAAVAEMERLGMILDVSHLSDDGFWHVDELATQPYIATHSSCRALCDHPRNLTDSQLQALGRAGGVVGINFYGRFIGEIDGAGSPIDLAIDHVVHALDVAGEDAVALGPDYMWDYCHATNPVLGVGNIARDMPEGLRRPDELPLFAARLADRVGEKVATKVCSANALRVLREILR